MKKLKLNLILIALILGVTGAVAFKPAEHKAKAGDPTLYWFDAGGGYTTDVATESAEKSSTLCDASNSDLCEKGYTSGELMDPDHPENGPQEGADPVIIHPRE